LQSDQERISMTEIGGGLEADADPPGDWLINPDATAAERLAGAVLMFWAAGPWTGRHRVVWKLLTGTNEATSKTLGDMARKVLAEASADRREGANGMDQQVGGSADD
jgi:hypothetical protein